MASSSLPSNCSLTLQAHNGAVNVALFNSRAAYILTAGADRSVRLFSSTKAAPPSGSGDAASLSTPIKAYENSSHPVTCLALSASDALFAQGGADRNALLVDVPTGSITRRFNAHAGPLHALAFAGAGDSLLVAAGFDARVRFYDLRAQGAYKPIMELKEARDTVMASACRESSVWTGSVDGVVRRYDVRMGTLDEDVIGEPIVSITPTSSSVLISSLSPAEAKHRLLSTVNGTLEKAYVGHANASYALRSRFAGGAKANRIISGNEDGGMLAWDRDSGEVVQRYDLDVENAKAIGPTVWVDEGSDGSLLSAHKDGSLRVWSGAALLR